LNVALFVNAKNPGSKPVTSPTRQTGHIASGSFVAEHSLPAESRGASVRGGPVDRASFGEIAFAHLQSRAAELHVPFAVLDS
jgi:hypothetical protein